MCWKQEWAMAINNLERAKEHIAKARAKLQARKARNEKNLEMLRRSKKHNYPSELQPVEALIARNEKGIWECEHICCDLEARQDQLYRMIKVYGIKRSENPERVRQLMGTYVPKEAI